jgi:surface protein
VATPFRCCVFEYTTLEFHRITILTRFVTFLFWNGTFFVVCGGLWSFFSLLHPFSLLAVFYGASAFNSDVSKWNTGAVTDMDTSKYTLSPSLCWPRLPSLRILNIRQLEVRRITSLTRSVLFYFQVFYNSGFKRTLCGGKWQSLSSDSGLTSTGRLGCCSPGTFMAKPTLNPFSKATACEACPVGQYGSTVDDDITSCNNNCGTSGNGANAATITCTTDTDQVATTCNAGYGLIGSACVACDAFTYAVQGNSAVCQTCASGSYTDTGTGTTGTTCQTCATSGNGANAATITCTSGIGQIATTCDAGYGLVGSACGACDAFTYAVQGNSAECQTCATIANAATVQCTTGSNEKITTCDAGYFGNSGDASCQSCGAGSITNTGTSAGATTCTPCAAGTYSLSSNVASCSTCATSGNGANAATTTCTTGTNQVATTCNAGYGLVGSACAATCKDGYGLVGSGNTEPQDHATIELAKEWLGKSGGRACVVLQDNIEAACAASVKNCSLADKLVECNTTQLAKIAEYYQSRDQC